MEVRTKMKRIAILMLVVALAAAMMIPAYAVGFTPSVEAKPAPEIVSQTSKDGNEYGIIIYDADEEEVVGVPLSNLIVTPVSQASAAEPEIKENLESAYKQIQSVSSLTELSEDLESVIKEVSPTLTADDLVIRDLLDVTVTGYYADYLNQEGNHITVRFSFSADEIESLVAILHNYEGSNWETVPNDRINRNKDNTVDVVFYSLSPVAFVFDKEILNVDPDAPVAP